MSEAVPQVLPLQHPERVAASTIRGYLFQAVQTARRWIELGPREILICEGIEDIDRMILGEDGVPSILVAEQVKLLEGRISARSPEAYETIFNFLVAFKEHDSAGLQCVFVFTTTALFARQRPLSTGDEPMVDLLQAWSRISDSTSSSGDFGGVKRAVMMLVEQYGQNDSDGEKKGIRSREIQDALEYLNGEQHRWSKFLKAVRWEMGAPG